MDSLLGTQSKAAAERAQMFPLRRGGHTVREVAMLMQDGMSIEDIARLWGLRQKAGPKDLFHELLTVWIEAGRPGGPPGRRPPYRDRDACRAWAEQSRQAALSWIRAAGSGFAFKHCPTCTCSVDGD